VATRRPALRFVLPASVTAPAVELCRRRACDQTALTATVDPSGTRAVPDEDLDPGVWYWRVRAQSPAGAVASPVWQLTVSQAAGAQAASALDLDGDGFAELAIGVPNAGSAEAASGTGRVYVYGGGADGPSPTRVTVLESPVFGAQFGHALAAVDYDGDGFADLAVGAPGVLASGAALRGRIYIFRGGPSGVAAAPAFELSTPISNDLGWSLDSAGDVNGDGYGDLVAGAPLTDASGAQSGAAIVFFGGVQSDALVAPALPESGPLVKAGWSVAGGGDFDGDGLSDVLVGVPDSPSTTAGHGRAYLYFGDTYGLAETPLVLDVGAPEQAAFGAALTLGGDFDGDGHPDLAVGAPGDGPGRVHLYFGGQGRAPRPSPSARLDGPDGDGGQFGTALSVGDFDGDGKSELAVGALCAPSGSSCAGRAYLFSGSALRASFTGPNAEALYGISLMLSGDQDGDGRADLAVSATGFEADLGRVDWFHGAATAPSTAARVLTGSDPEGRYGFSLR
jgi:hypothetical protein